MFVGICCLGSHLRDYLVKFVDLKFTEDVLFVQRTTANGQHFIHSREKISTLMNQILYPLHINGLKEISLPLRSVVYAMKHVVVKGAFRVFDVFGVA